jgi:hypothetical protein
LATSLSTSTSRALNVCVPLTRSASFAARRTGTQVSRRAPADAVHQCLARHVLEQITFPAA